MPCACGSAAVLHVATCGSTAELACVPISLTAPSPLPPPFEFGALSDIRWEHCCGSTAMHLCSEENTQSLLLMAVLPEDRQYVPPALEAPPQLCISSPCVGCLPCRRSWWADLRTDVTLHHIVRLHAARTRSLKIWVSLGQVRSLNTLQGGLRQLPADLTRPTVDPAQATPVYTQLFRASWLSPSWALSYVRRKEDDSCRAGELSAALEFL